MFAIANTYKTSAEVVKAANDVFSSLASKQGIKRPNGKDPLKFDEVILSRVLLYAVHIEILLKALYLYDNDTTTNGHEWDTLFNKLSETRKDEIRKAMPTQFQADFDTLLTNNRKTFIEWRYCYEQANLQCDFTFIVELGNALSGIVLKLANQP